MFYEIFHILCHNKPEIKYLVKYSLFYRSPYPNISVCRMSRGLNLWVELIYNFHIEKIRPPRNPHNCDCEKKISIYVSHKIPFFKTNNLFFHTYWKKHLERSRLKKIFYAPVISHSFLTNNTAYWHARLIANLWPVEFMK